MFLIGLPSLTPLELKWLDITGLILNFLGGILLAYDLLSEPRRWKAHAAASKLDFTKELRETVIRSYAPTLDRSDVPSDLKETARTERDAKIAEFEKSINELQITIDKSAKHPERAVIAGIIGIVIIIIGFGFQLIKELLS